MAKAVNTQNMSKAVAFLDKAEALGVRYVATVDALGKWVGDIQAIDLNRLDNRATEAFRMLEKNYGSEITHEELVDAMLATHRP